MRLKCVFLTGFLLFAQTGFSALWPFDQRQVLLVHTQDTVFPDELTTAQIMDKFVERGRIRWMTESGSSSKVLPLQVPKDFVWDRPSNVRALGLRYGADGVVVLEEKNSKIDIRWYAVVDGQPLYYESLYLPASSGSEEQNSERKRRLRSWLDEVWKRIPGQGFVAKRDIENLQLEGIEQEGLQAGDQLVLLRLNNVIRHPVLKTLMSFEYSETGLAQITNVSKPFSTAKVIYESKLDAIREGDRYLLKKKPEVEVVTHEGFSELSKEADGSSDQEDFRPAQFFQITPRIGLGTLSYEERVGAELYSLNNFSWSYGFKADLLLTRSWYASLQMDMGVAKFSSLPSSYVASSMGSGWNRTRVDTGYKLSMGEGLGVATVSGGYSRFHFKAESLASPVAPSAKSYSGLDVGLTISLPVSGVWFVESGFTRVLSTFLKENALTSGASSSNSSWSFFAQAKLRPTDRTELGMGYEVFQGSSSFEGNGTRLTPSVSTKASSQRLMMFYGYTL